MFKFILAFLLPAMMHNSDTTVTIADAQKVRTIYLTFDGGPDAGSAEVNFLILEEEVRATVFLEGVNLWNHPKAARYYYFYHDDPFIECGNGGFVYIRDQFKYYKDPDYVLYDFALNDYYFGFNNLICRLPGRNSWRLAGRSLDESEDTRAAADRLAGYDCKVFGWDLEWTANRKTRVLDGSPDQMIARIDRLFKDDKTFTHDHLVLRCQDLLFRKEVNTHKMKMLIEKIKAQGVYRFEYLSNYPDYSISAHNASIAR